MKVQEVSESFDAYFLDGSIEAFESTASALNGRLGFTYPENIMVLVIPAPLRPALECPANTYIVSYGGDLCQKFTPEEFEAKFQIIEP